MRNWYHFVWLCGDHIVEQHVHNLDVCNWVKGDHPVEANGMGSCHVPHNRGMGQIYDNHFVEFTYKDGTKMYSQCRQQPNTWCSVTSSSTAQGHEGTAGLGRRRPFGNTWTWSTPFVRARSSTTVGTAPPAASPPCWAAWRPIRARLSIGTRRLPRGPTKCRPVRLRRRSAGHARQGRQLPHARPRRLQGVLTMHSIRSHVRLVGFPGTCGRVSPSLPAENDTGKPTASERLLLLEDLRCEYLRNPVGIDTERPRLSWTVNPNGAVRNRRPTRHWWPLDGSGCRKTRRSLE